MLDAEASNDFPYCHQTTAKLLPVVSDIVVFEEIMKAKPVSQMYSNAKSDDAAVCGEHLSDVCCLFSKQRLHPTHRLST